MYLAVTSRASPVPVPILCTAFPICILAIDMESYGSRLQNKHANTIILLNPDRSQNKRQIIA